MGQVQWPVATVRMVLPFGMNTLDNTVLVRCDLVQDQLQARPIPYGGENVRHMSSNRLPELG